MRRTAAILSKRFTSSGSQKIVACLTSQAQSQSRCFSALPDSVSRVGVSTVFPNEYPGHDYKFNWQLNADGVTPLKKSAFRITKPLDLKIAGLSQPKTMPLKVKSAAASKMPEAGSDALSFDEFDDAIQKTKDALSLSSSLFCPEGHAPSTRTGVRIISNSASLAPNLLAYLDRAPVRKNKPESLPITVYACESDETFAGYAIEEDEVYDQDGNALEPRSVAAVVVSGKTLDIKLIAKGIELSVAGLEADEKERAEAAAAEES